MFRKSYIQKVLYSEDPCIKKVLSWNTFPAFSFRHKKQISVSFITFYNFYKFRSSQISRTWKPEPKFRCSQFRHHAWRFGLRLFIVIDRYFCFFTMISDHILQLNCRLKITIYCAAPCITYCAVSSTPRPSLQCVLLCLFFCDLGHVLHRV